MTKDKKPKKTATPEATGDGDDTVGAQLAGLKKLVGVLMVVCLLTSAGLNVYLASEVALTRDELSSSQSSAEGCREAHQLFVRLVGELSQMGRTSPEVKNLLKKFWVPLVSFGLMRQDVAGPAGRGE